MNVALAYKEGFISKSLKINDSKHVKKFFKDKTFVETAKTK